MPSIWNYTPTDLCASIHHMYNMYIHMFLHVLVLLVQVAYVVKRRSRRIGYTELLIRLLQGNREFDKWPARFVPYV